MPGIETLSAYIIGIIFVVIVVALIIKSAKKITFLLMNTLFGGALFAILNILGMGLPVTWVTVILTCFLGIPGVILIIILKFVLGVL